MNRRRRFGSIRQLPSGRWQARYQTPHGRAVTAPHTFRTRTDAHQWLVKVESSIIQGTWSESATTHTVEETVTAYIASRHLAEQTVTDYRRYLSRYIAPHLGHVPVAALRPTDVAAWVTTLRQLHPGSHQPPKAYRLLHAALADAVRLEVIPRNPCIVAGAGIEHHPERIIPTPDQVAALLNNTPPRYFALVLLAAYSALRQGELFRLERGDFDSARRTLRIRRAKSRAGIRVVTLPAVVADTLASHLDATPGSTRSLIFTSPRGAALNGSNFTTRVWSPIRDAAGMPWLHFHDLRHFAGTTTAQAGATIKELMAVLGHSTPRAAMIYQHVASDRAQHLADRVNDLIPGSLNGTQLARVTPSDPGQRVGIPGLTCGYAVRPRVDSNHRPAD